MSKRKHDDDYKLLGYKLEDPKDVIPAKPKISPALRRTDRPIRFFDGDDAIINELNELQNIDEVTAIQIQISQIRTSILDIIQKKQEQEARLEKECCIVLKRFRPKPIDELPFDVFSFYLEELFGRLSEIVAGEIAKKEYEAAEDREVALALAEKMGYTFPRRCIGKGKNKDEGSSIISLFGREVYDKIMELYNNDLCPICLEFLGKKEHCKNACEKCTVLCHVDCLVHWGKNKCLICRNDK